MAGKCHRNSISLEALEKSIAYLRVDFIGGALAQQMR